MNNTRLLWHDDASFVVKHVAFTLSMEESLRSIDGTVAVPYWDYTVDAATIDATPGSMWWDQSEIFTRQCVFGELRQLGSAVYLVGGCIGEP